MISPWAQVSLQNQASLPSGPDSKDLYEVKSESGDGERFTLPIKKIIITGSEINFFGRCQLATDYFFSRHMRKCGRQKALIKFFFRSKTQIDGKLLLPIFL